MSIDERIEAIAQSLELLAGMHRELEKQTAARFTETLGFINQLAHAAEAHEQRIERLEDRQAS
jgi:hypothetical protein